MSSFVDDLNLEFPIVLKIFLMSALGSITLKNIFKTVQIVLDIVPTGNKNKSKEQYNNLQDR